MSVSITPGLIGPSETILSRVVYVLSSQLLNICARSESLPAPVYLKKLLHDWCWPGCLFANSYPGKSYTQMLAGWLAGFEKECKVRSSLLWDDIYHRSLAPESCRPL